MSEPPGDRRRILAMGGGGFTMTDASDALDRLVLTLTGKPVPRICFLPTASGDPREQTTRFVERFSAWPCQPSVLSLFHLARDRLDPTVHLLAQDAIYVGGGSMRNMLAVWREHGVDEAMREAWERGVVLAGLSAGAMCWFEGGITRSGGAPAPAAGLGLLPGSMSVHLDSEPDRLPMFRDAIAAGSLPPGYAADDCAGLVFAGRRLELCVGSRPGARVLKIGRAPEGHAGSEELPVKLLPGVGDGPDAAARASRSASTSASTSAEVDAVSELREFRAGGHRWD